MAKTTSVAKRKVAGKLLATFEMNGDRPDYDDVNGVKHYWINIRFEPTEKDSVDRVTFTLDENTYEDPIIVADREMDFTDTISSYGDYFVTAKIESQDEFFSAGAWLSDMLKAGYPDAEPSAPIGLAIADIEQN
jgi:hypothetical protein